MTALTSAQPEPTRGENGGPASQQGPDRMGETPRVAVGAPPLPGKASAKRPEPASWGNGKRQQVTEAQSFLPPRRCCWVPPG